MLDGYTLLHTISKGSHSTVKLARDRQGKYICAKLLYYRSESEKSLVKTLISDEVKALRRISGSKTIQLLGFSNESKHIVKNHIRTCGYLLSSYCPLGSLAKIVTLIPNESTARYFFIKLINALETIHTQGFAHLNIRLEHILLDTNMDIKLCSLGSSSYESSKFSKNSLYTAPEVLAYKSSDNKKVDLFALGVVLFMVVCKSPPFMKATVTDNHYKMIINKNARFWSGFRDVSEDFKDLVTGILMDPKDRLDFEGIKAHRWVKGEVNLEEVGFIRRKLMIE